MDQLVGTESEVTSKDVQTPNAKSRGSRERRAIPTSSTKNVVRRSHGAESSPAAGTSPPVPNMIIGIGTGAIWYRSNPFGTGPGGLVLARTVWYWKFFFGI
jgi:hypothetical protein